MFSPTLTRSVPTNDLAWSHSLLGKLTRFLSCQESLPPDLFVCQGNQVEAEALKYTLENEPTDLVTGNPLVVGKVLLQVLREMPEPLLSFQAYDSFLMIQYVEKESDKLDITRSLLKAIQTRPKSLLYQLVSLLLYHGEKNVIPLGEWCG
eukprot:TRINITY_DN8117_c0_g1_i2.p1 TRINITY_DN8117_c0_g1~~TRINITY_DN8117_c0_g1_i2.p1  ORF type:complete len:175 (+),score=26.52 TRINITY_DN8117_c0_g1_i2:77-526(+)